MLLQEGLACTATAAGTRWKHPSTGQVQMAGATGLQQGPAGARGDHLAEAGVHWWHQHHEQQEARQAQTCSLPTSGSSNKAQQHLGMAR